MELVLYGSCWSQRGTIINLPHFSSYQPTATRTPIQPLKYQSYVNQVPIIHQSEEDNCPSNKGTSVLHEATEVSRRRTIQTMNFWVSLTNSPTHGQYKTNLPIHHQLRDSVSSFHWLSSSIFSCCSFVCCSSRIGNTSSHLHNMMFQTTEIKYSL